VPASLAALTLVLATGLPGSAPLCARLDAALPSQSAGAERATWASALLLGAPYLPSPLGEGSGFDPDPRFRLDAFDCVTFVETAVALGSARSVEEAERLLDDVRYDGAPGYRSRSHYVESQWIPSLVKKGWLEPVTRQVAGQATARVVKHLDDAAWERAERSGHLLPGLSRGDVPKGDFALDLVPLSLLSRFASRIPNGTVLVVLREERATRPSQVSHMGIVAVRGDGTRVLRHASDVPGVMRVRDEPLEAFAHRAARHEWKIVGVSLYRIRDNSQRAEALTAEGLRDGEPAGR